MLVTNKLRSIEISCEVLGINIFSITASTQKTHEPKIQEVDDEFIERDTSVEDDDLSEEVCDFVIYLVATH